MNKYSLIGIVGLVVLLIGAAVWWFHTKPGSVNLFTHTPPSLLTYLSDDVDQAISIEITPATKDFLLASNQGIDSTSLKTVLDSLTHIVIAQAAKNQDEAYSILILAGNEQFSIDQIQALGLVYFDTGYTTREIARNIRLYGDIASIDHFVNKQRALTDHEDVQHIMREAKNQQASVLFFSRPLIDNNADILTHTFANKLQYSALYGTPALGKSKGTFVLQFTGTQFAKTDEVFSLRHNDLLTDRTVLYLESNKLLRTLGISSQSFTTSLQGFLSQLGTENTDILAPEELQELYNSLDKHLGIIIDATENALGLNARIRLENNDVYGSLLSLQPLWKGLAASFFGTSDTFTEIKEEGSRTLAAPLPGSEDSGSLLAENSFPIIRISQDSENSTIEILPSMSSGDRLSTTSTQYTANSLISFRYNPIPLIEKGDSSPLLSDLIEQIQIIGTGVIVGQVQIDADQQQLIATFETY